MNLVTVISVFLIAATVAELLLDNMPRMAEQLYKLAFAVTMVGFTIKYYYGPDITTYVPFYESMEPWGDLTEAIRTTSFETGFVVYCWLCRSAGLSFWWMTAVVSVLFFGATYMLIGELKEKKTLALTLIVVLMPDLITAQLRQCMAVSMFIFTILAARKNHMVQAVVFCILAFLMHKASLLVILPALAYWGMQRIEISNNIWAVLMIGLAILLVVSDNVIVDSLMKMSADGLVSKSISYHLSFAKQVQLNFVFYMLAIVVMVQFSRRKQGRDLILAVATAGMIVVVMFYQHFMLLNRLRAYFVIFIIVYIFNFVRKKCEDKAPYINIVRQASIVFLLMFVCYKTITFDVNWKRDGNAMEACTLFDLRHSSAEEIKQRQIIKANNFWDEYSDSMVDKYQNKNYRKRN